MSKLHRNILIVLLYISVITIIVLAYIIGKNKPRDPYVQWPNAINTLEAEKQMDCDGDIIWIQQSDAYGNDTSFPVCSSIDSENNDEQ